MSDTPNQGPAWLDNLSPDVVMTASILPKPVVGPDAVRKVIRTGGSMYVTQTFTFKGEAAGRDIVEFDAKLRTGEAIHCIVSLAKDDQGVITHITLGHSPLESVLALAELVKDAG